MDKAKIETIEKLPSPTSIKGIRSFLSHAGFYSGYIKDLSTISKPFSSILMQGVPFHFDEKCKLDFSTLKEKLTPAPIVIALDWTLPFELMCDASDYVVELFWLNRRTKFSMLYNMQVER